MIKQNFVMHILIFTILITPFYFAQSGVQNAERVAGGSYVLKLDNQGRLSCESVLKDESLSKRTENNLNYTLVRSLNDTNLVRDGLKIILRATDQLMDNPQALLAFRRAAAIWERRIKTDITAIIDVDYGKLRFGEPWGSGVLGSTGSAQYYPVIDNQYLGVSSLVDKLKDIHSDDPQLLDLYDAIPIPTPTTQGEPFERLRGSFILLQALGYFEQVSNPDDYTFASGNVAIIGFNSNFSYDLNPNDGITPGSYDFDGVVVHEIGHALGFNAISFYTSAGPPNNDFLPWDLFRVRPEAVEPGSLEGFANAERVASPGPPDSEPWPGEPNFMLGTHAFFDGQNEWECSTALGNGSGGDGSQSSHWRDDNLRPLSLGEERYIGIMDPNSGTGVRDTLKYPDMRMLEVIGYKMDYSPAFSDMSVSVDGNSIYLDALQDTVSFGDIDVNTTADKVIHITNNSLDTDLMYQVDYETRLTYPDNFSYDIQFDKVSSTVPVGQADDLTLTVGNSPEGGIYLGLIRLHTNSDQRLVVEIPFEFNVGGVVAPTASLSTADLGEIRIEDKNADPVVSRSFMLSNTGTLPLEYIVTTSLSAPSATPPELLKAGSKSNSALKTFFSDDVLTRVSTLYEEDFESDWGGFSPAGNYTEDWNRTDVGKAALEGHSPTMAVYYGSLDSMLHKDQGDAWLIGPPMDFSNVPPEDMVVFSFNYFLDAEEGYDFASVHVSIDGGDSFTEVATSNGGIIDSSVAGWESVMIQLPLLSGNAEPVVFAFRFKSDQLVHYEGWYIDDVMVSTIEGANTMYTTPRGGSLVNQNDSEEISLFINTAELSGGWYDGAVTLSTNDYKRETINVPFLLSKLIIEPTVLNKMYASTGRGSGSEGRILEINLETGAGTEIGVSGFEPLSSITVNWDNGELYAINNAIGQPTTIIRTDATAGGGLYHFQMATKLQAMVFDDDDNTLYGVGADKKLYSVDPLSGAVTEIGDLGLRIQSITADPFGHMLYGSVAETAQKDRIYRIDKSNADTIRVGQTGLNKRIEALAFDSEGNLYGAQGSEQQLSTLIKIDPVTGIAVEVGSVGYRGVLGLTYSLDPVTGTNERTGNTIPDEYNLSQNYPNPFNPATTINYSLPLESSVKIRVFNSLGQVVNTLVNKNVNAGNHQISWDASGLASGIYFYNIEAVAADGSQNFNYTRKMLMIK